MNPILNAEQFRDGVREFAGSSESLCRTLIDSAETMRQAASSFADSVSQLRELKADALTPPPEGGRGSGFDVGRVPVGINGNAQPPSAPPDVAGREFSDWDMKQYGNPHDLREWAGIFNGTVLSAAVESNGNKADRLRVDLKVAAARMERYKSERDDCAAEIEKCHKIVDGMCGIVGDGTTSADPLDTRLEKFAADRASRKPSESEARTIAEAAAKRLMSSGIGDKPKRLVLEMPSDEFNGAGWCEAAIADQVQAAILGYTPGAST